MNTAHDRITVSIERPLLDRIKSDAEAQNRSVSQQLEWLARNGLARLDEELHAIIGRRTAAPDPCTEAAKAHLREHRRLSGLKGDRDGD